MSRKVKPGTALLNGDTEAINKLSKAFFNVRETISGTKDAMNSLSFYANTEVFTPELNEEVSVALGQLPNGELIIDKGFVVQIYANGSYILSDDNSISFPKNPRIYTRLANRRVRV